MRLNLRLACCATVASLFGLPAFALNVNDQVKINEVSYDPSESPEDPFEFIELYNAGPSTVYLDGAAFSDEGNNGTGEATFVFPGTPGGTTIPLASHAFLLIVGDATGTTLPADWEFYGGGTDSDDPGVPNLTKTAGTGGDLFLGNSGDGVTLSTGASNGSIIPCGEVVDGVSWEGGGTNEVYAMSSTVCSDPASNAGYTNVVPEVKTLQRCPDGFDTDNSANDFIVNNRTPKASNGCSTAPPVITSLRYEPCFVTAGQQPTVVCTVTDLNADITSVRVYYKLDTAALFDSLAMSLGAPNTYSAQLPGQADQAHVQYYVGARDGTGNFVKNPSTAPAFLRTYRVGLQTIASVQVPAVSDSCSASSQLGKAVNLVGVVTNLPYEYSGNFFYIQRGTAANSGIKVFTSVDSSFVPNLGDSVRVSGYIDEFNCQTEIVLFADCGTILGHNKKVTPRLLASLSDIKLEQNESMLVTVQGPLTVSAGFDTTNLGSEFKVGSGSNIAYVGDDTFYPDLIGYTVVPTPGMVLDALTGVVGYRRADTTVPRADPNIILRLEPRRDNDVDRDYTDVGDPDQIDVVRAFNLNQNRPNPFNPVTTIEFAVPAAGRVKLEIYNAKGQLVRNLIDAEYTKAAHERVTWDGRDDAGRVVPSGVYFYTLLAGDQSATRKMLLLK
jgi:Lamin Tail Domain/FlgD Ig-like domain